MNDPQYYNSKSERLTTNVCIGKLFLVWIPIFKESMCGTFSYPPKIPSTLIWAHFQITIAEVSLTELQLILQVSSTQLSVLLCCNKYTYKLLIQRNYIEPHNIFFENTYLYVDLQKLIIRIIVSLCCMVHPRPFFNTKIYVTSKKKNSLLYKEENTNRTFFIGYCLIKNINQLQKIEIWLLKMQKQILVVCSVNSLTTLFV